MNRHLADRVVAGGGLVITRHLEKREPCPIPGVLHIVPRCVDL